MAGQPKLRHKKAQRRLEDPTRAHVQALYSEQYTTFDALRAAMVQNGIVDHGINPYDCIQRAIDDTASDYLLLRRKIDRDTHGDPTKLEDHPLYYFHEHVREAMVRYSTFAMQYDIQKRQIKLGETRVALLAHTLRSVLTGLGIDQDTVREVPRLLIQQLQIEQTKSEHTNPARNAQPQRIDPLKAEALAEILHNESEVEIIDVDPDSNGHAK
jgi:hypothetical protein